MALGYQLAELLREGYLREYLEPDQGEPQEESAPRDQTHEVPIHVELNTISGGFSGGGSTTTKCKQYARVVMSLETWDQDDPHEIDL